MLRFIFEGKIERDEGENASRMSNLGVDDALIFLVWENR